MRKIAKKNTPLKFEINQNKLACDVYAHVLFIEKFDTSHILFRKPMCWTTTHDDMLIREILLYQPWDQKKGSPERGMGKARAPNSG